MGFMSPACSVAWRQRAGESLPSSRSLYEHASDGEERFLSATRVEVAAAEPSC
jgi:hypothetical protein